MSSKESSSELIFNAINNSSQAILVLDLTGNVIWSNNRSAELLGIEISSPIELSFGEIFTDPEGELWKELVDNSDLGKLTIDTTLKLTSGRNIALLIEAIREQEQLYLYLSDNTDLNWLRQEIRLTTEQMERNQTVAREKESYLRAIFRSSGIGIALLNLNGTIIECNSVFQTLTGKTIEQLRMSSFASYIHPDDIKGAVAIFNDLAAGKCSHYQIEQRQLNVGRRVSWVKVSASLIRSNSGRPDYALFIVEDISEQKQAEESFQRSELKYRALFEGMLDGFACYKAIYDDEENIVDFEFAEINDAFAVILELERKTIQGRLLSEVAEITPFTFEWSRIFKKVQECKMHLRHDVYSYKQEKWFSVLAYSPEPGYFATFIEDITERRQIEEEIRVFATELECSNRELEHFVNRASGELTNRLCLISEVVKSIDTGSCMDSQTSKALEMILTHSDSLQGMLDGLLVYSRMVYRGNPFDDVDLNKIVEQLKISYASSIADGHLTITSSRLPVIDADGQQIQLLFDKILEGVRFFAASENITADISAIQSGKNWDIGISISEVDIPPSILKLFFDAFRSFEYKNKTYSTGIHLPLCKKIVERHNGQIAIGLPEPGKSVFHLTFPIPALKQ